ELKRWMYFNGRVWCVDNGCRAEAGARVLYDMARDEVAAAEAGGTTYPDLRKWLRRVSQGAPTKLLQWAMTDRRTISEPHEFDASNHMIAVANGMIDLDTLSFQPHHDPKALLTKEIKVVYDKDADAPQWTRFLEEVLPDADMRAYVQRAVGHTLLGDADRRALFLLHGPSGTGKS